MTSADLYPGMNSHMDLHLVSGVELALLSRAVLPQTNEAAICRRLVLQLIKGKKECLILLEHVWIENSDNGVAR